MRYIRLRDFGPIQSGNIQRHAMVVRNEDMAPKMDYWKALRNEDMAPDVALEVLTGYVHWLRGTWKRMRLSSISRMHSCIKQNVNCTIKF